MSVKVGVAPGLWAWEGGRAFFFRFVEACEASGWDSLWLSDRLISERLSLEPVVALAAVAARTKRMKFGTSVIALPLRNPVVLARELATVNFLSGGRLLPAVGLGGDDEREYEATGTRKCERGPRTDEAIGLLRRLWGEDGVTHHGRFYDLTDVTIRPKPARGLPIWIGGRTEAAWRRVADLGDGWLASGVTPLDVFEGRAAIRAHLEANGRTIEEDHYGVMLMAYLAGSTEEALDRLAVAGMRRRPDVPLESYAALGTARDIHERLREYRAAGANKFVLRLACREDEALDQLERLAEAVAAPLNSGSLSELT